MAWRGAISSPAARAKAHRVIDADMVSILYTSGSTGKPKGVVLSHKNMVTGAESVAQYLENTPDDRLLAVLPFSFDYGFSQLSTAFHVGASVVLMDYLLAARRHERCSRRERITGLAGVPPLWAQLADLEWPARVDEQLRYITNSGGAMPRATLAKLRAALPKTKPFLMYGLTEAFRSTYLPTRGGRPPSGLDRQGDSERRDPRRASRRHRVRAGRARRARASRLAGRARLLERSGEDRAALQARAGPGPGAGAHGDSPCGPATPCAATRRASCTSSAAATR